MSPLTQKIVYAKKDLNFLFIKFAKLSDFQAIFDQRTDKSPKIEKRSGSNFGRKLPRLCEWVQRKKVILGRSAVCLAGYAVLKETRIFHLEFVGVNY